MASVSFTVTVLVLVRVEIVGDWSIVIIWLLLVTEMFAEEAWESSLLVRRIIPAVRPVRMLMASRERERESFLVGSWG